MSEFWRIYPTKLKNVFETYVEIVDVQYDLILCILHILKTKHAG